MVRKRSKMILLIDIVSVTVTYMLIYHCNDIYAFRLFMEFKFLKHD